jgi:hypothetical protein
LQRARALTPRDARGDAYALWLHGLNPIMAVFFDECLNQCALCLIRHGTRAHVLPYRLKVTGVETHNLTLQAVRAGHATDDQGVSVA